MIAKLVAISLTAILAQNFVLVKFLGICPFLGVSKKVDTALGMGMAVTFVMTLASMMTYFCQNLILVPLGIEYMQTIAFIVIIAALVQFVEMFLQKYIPSLYSALGIYLPLITTNCAVLGVALQNVQNEYNFVSSVVNGIGTSVGFTIAIVIMAGIRERNENNNIIGPLKGMPIVLFTAALMAIAFNGFSGLI